jgi:hypothetical protein
MILAIIFLSLLCYSQPITAHAGHISLELLEQQDYLTLQVNITGLERTTCKDKTCYLQALITHSLESPRYFGYTLGQNDWFAYISKPEPQFIRDNFPGFNANPEGSWSGMLRVALDQDSSHFKGSGTYHIRVRRYTGESSSPATDELDTLAIQYHLPEITPTSTTAPNTPTPTLKPTLTPTTTQSIPKPPISSQASQPPLQSSSIDSSNIETLSLAGNQPQSVSGSQTVLSYATTSSHLVYPKSTSQESSESSQTDSKIRATGFLSQISFLHIGGFLTAITSFILLMRSLKSNND